MIGPAAAAFPDPRAWSGRRVLVTGNSGFKGSWLSCWLAELGADVLGLSLPDPPSTPSLWVDLDLGLPQVAGDIREAGWAPAVREFSPQVVFHLAAQPIVAVGYSDPMGTFGTNVLGTARLLQDSRSWPELAAFVVITTDKVYDTRQRGPYVEGDYLGGGDPYSASKAAAELVCASWPAPRDGIVTARAGNVVGGGDWAAARLVPDMVRAWAAGRSLRLRDPSGVRPWQHVLEPLRGYLLYAEAVLAGRGVPRALNFGPSGQDMLSVGELVQFCAEQWAAPDDPPGWEAVDERGYAETSVLTLDSRAAADALGWRGLMDWRMTMTRTLAWYRDYLAGHPARGLVRRDLEHYYELGHS